ncbi:MAG TPA: NAD-dependent epimerase/dehydratase family protein, partial [Gemmatimonadales bacterium]|nr:NAD-dependent epimerase/dehydratase family protein [Gemmatimonadales bacterium]
MRILVTGGDGFAGGWLVRRLVADGHEVTATRRPGAPPSPVLRGGEAERIEWLDLELGDAGSVAGAGEREWDAVAHLAALASGGEARRDPGRAWEINAAGTARLAGAIAGRGPGPVFLLVSTGEVYGKGRGASRRETDPPEPCSPYAASKLGAEVAVQETARRTGLRVIIARAFPHTGPGQDARFVIPALAERLRTARRAGVRVIKVGNLEPVRDLLDVRDVAAAYAALLARGSPGEIYNVASGSGRALTEVLHDLERLLEWRVTPEPDPALTRPADLMHLVGDSARLRAATGWAPAIPLDRTLTDLLDAQAD